MAATTGREHTALERALNLDNNRKCMFVGTDTKPSCGRDSFVKEHEIKKRVGALVVGSLTGHEETTVKEQQNLGCVSHRQASIPRMS